MLAELARLHAKTGALQAEWSVPVVAAPFDDRFITRHRTTTQTCP